MSLHREALTALLLATVSASCGRSPPPYDVHITSLDPQRGVPTLLWSQPGQGVAAAPITPEAVASGYLERLAPLYGLTEDSLGTASVHQVHDTGRGGILVSFRQRVGGIEVFGSELDVLLSRDLRLVAIGGNLQAAALPRQHPFQLSPREAVAHALGELPGHELSAARPILYPLDRQLVPAYRVETFLGTDASTTSSAYASIVSADDGTVLMRESLTHTDSFEYRVWADTTGDKTPLDGPQADYTPHPTGTPDGREPGFTPSRLVSIDGAWLSPGATESRGNNVDAYADLSAPDGFTAGSDLHATVTRPGSFDHVYDTGLGHQASTEQTQAAITQLFYTTNWLHDDFYASGFDEAAGNAQAVNFGRGGVEGDPLLAEAQDWQGYNNATMTVPADGTSPRMQVFIWSGGEKHFVEASGQRYVTGTAFFGPQAFQVTKRLVLVDDGVASPNVHDGCEPIASDLSERLVLIERGTCSLALKARNAEQAGAAGVLIINNTPGAPPPRMTNDNPPLVVTVPVLSVSYEDGATLVKAAEQQGPLTATLSRQVIDRDGALDNTLVAHEWGHYLHQRLMTSCTTHQCLAMSEGWADFIALHMMLREGDPLEGSYAIAGYATVELGNSAYFGIRRAPYSVDTNINALSLRHMAQGEPLPTHHPLANRVPDNAEVHNAGEVFAALLLEGYIALLRETRLPTPRYSFTQARRTMADYVVGAMKLAPPNATYTEQLQALLAVAAAHDLTDQALLAEAYARRGAGPCASAPPRNSTTLTGVVEDFSVTSDCAGNPVADAGPDRSVPGGGLVYLDASGSREPRGNPLTFQWHQVSGPAVVLEDGGKSVARFLAPVVAEDTVLSFRVTVGHGPRATVDTVELRVLAGDSGPFDGGVDAGTDAGAGSPPSDGGTEPDAGSDLDEGPVTAPVSGGCGATPGAPPHSTPLLLALLAVIGAARRP